MCAAEHGVLGICDICLLICEEPWSHFSEILTRNPLPVSAGQGQP